MSVSGVWCILGLKSTVSWSLRQANKSLTILVDLQDRFSPILMQISIATAKSAASQMFFDLRKEKSSLDEVATVFDVLLLKQLLMCLLGTNLLNRTCMLTEGIVTLRSIAQPLFPFHL